MRAQMVRRPPVLHEQFAAVSNLLDRFRGIVVKLRERVRLLFPLFPFLILLFFRVRLVSFDIDRLVALADASSVRRERIPRFFHPRATRRTATRRVYVQTMQLFQRRF